METIRRCKGKYGNLNIDVWKTNGMICGKHSIEQRKHKRFRVQYGAFVAFRVYHRKLGQIIDISRGGLAFRYIANGKRSKGPDQLDIMLVEKDFHLKKLPFKTIADFEITSEIPLNSLQTRRCGVQFGKLTKSQISQLDFFIKNHTIGEA
jgi:hypothetical protein